MSVSADEKILSFKCPKCGHKATAKLGQLQRQSNFTCPSCRARIPIKTPVDYVAAVKKKISGVGKQIKIKIKI